MDCCPIYCPTKRLFIAPIVQDKQQVYHLYRPDLQTVGIQCEAAARVLLCNIISAELTATLQHERFIITTAFRAAQDECTAVIVYLQPPLRTALWQQFATFPQALRSMPKDRKRLTILKLWQTYLV
ncbi:MAG: hypothetical protein OYH77_05630 [Pseudomonadota bacterium]|nr:hypothetical protein [Pseudomonadota bacterium]